MYLFFGLFKLPNFFTIVCLIKEKNIISSIFKERTKNWNCFARKFAFVVVLRFLPKFFSQNFLEEFFLLFFISILLFSNCSQERIELFFMSLKPQKKLYFTMVVVHTPIRTWLCPGRISRSFLCFFLLFLLW